MYWYIKISKQIQPTLERPLKRASTMLRSLGNALASRNTLRSRSSLRTTTGKNSNTETSGVFSTNLCKEEEKEKEGERERNRE